MKKKEFLPSFDQLEDRNLLSAKSIAPTTTYYLNGWMHYKMPYLEFNLYSTYEQYVIIPHKIREVKAIHLNVQKSPQKQLNIISMKRKRYHGSPLRTIIHKKLHIKKKLEGRVKIIIKRIAAVMKTLIRRIKVIILPPVMNVTPVVIPVIDYKLLRLFFQRR